MTERRRCPACGYALDEAFAPVVTTGEFTVPSASDLARLGVAEPVTPPAAPATPGATCSWCGRPGAEVRKLLTGPGVQICDGCVALCYEVLRAELPDFGG